MEELEFLYSSSSFHILVNLDEGKKRWFLEFYKRMSVCGNPNRNNRVGSVTLALQVLDPFEFKFKSFLIFFFCFNSKLFIAWSNRCTEVINIFSGYIT